MVRKISRANQLLCAAVLTLACVSSGTSTLAVADSSGPDAGAITAAGTARIERMPDTVRVIFSVSAEGPDVKAALAALREREQAARKKLSSLGASEEHVKVAAPQLAAPAGGGQPQMEALIRMRMGRSPARPTTGPAEPAVSLSSSITAEWKLSAKTVDDLLIESFDLKTRIDKADVAGKAQQKPLTPEEQELAEEQALIAQASGMPAQQEGLSLVYVSRISDEDRQALLTDAYAKAKAEAAMLAKAAGAALGPIKQIQTGQGGGEATDLYELQRQAQRMMYGMSEPPAVSDSETVEATATQPGKVSYALTVTASFAAK